MNIFTDLSPIQIHHHHHNLKLSSSFSLIIKECTSKNYNKTILQTNASTRKSNMTGLITFTLLSISPLLQSASAGKLRISDTLIKRRIPESCQTEMQVLENNDDLTDAMRNITTDFSLAFDTNNSDYCDIENTEESTRMNCLVDYKEFSSEYIDICGNSNARYNPLTVFMQCSANAITIEMELTNIPSCLSNSCAIADESIALSRSLQMVDAPEGFSCDYFHRTIGISDEISKGDPYRDISSATDSTKEDVDSTTETAEGESDSPKDDADTTEVDEESTEVDEESTDEHVQSGAFDSNGNEAEKISSSAQTSKTSLVGISSMLTLSFWLLI